MDGVNHNKIHRTNKSFWIHLAHMEKDEKNSVDMSHFWGYFKTTLGMHFISLFKEIHCTKKIRFINKSTSIEDGLNVLTVLQLGTFLYSLFRPLIYSQTVTTCLVTLSAGHLSGLRQILVHCKTATIILILLAGTP